MTQFLREAGQHIDEYFFYAFMCGVFYLMGHQKRTFAGMELAAGIFFIAVFVAACIVAVVGDRRSNRAIQMVRDTKHHVKNDL